MSEYKEFWVNPKPHSGHRGRSSNRLTAWNVRPSYQYDVIHVIEKAAYDELAKEIATLRKLSMCSMYGTFGSDLKA